MDSRIYLDFAATTPLRPEALEAMRPFFSEAGFNPSSLHAEGRRARAALDEARDRVAALLGVGRKELTFSGSGTESDNQAILGVARAHPEKRHVVATTIEHHAVLHALDALREQEYEITLVPVGEQGVVDVNAFKHAVRDDTLLASVMYGNNEIGVIQPVQELASIAHERGALFHTDAVQAAGWLAIRPRTLGVDLLTLSAHKFYGPKGVGMLFARDGVRVEPLVYGGGQEFGKRSGTENVAGIVGAVAAFELAQSGVAERSKRVGALRNRLEEGIVASIGDVRVNGAGASRLPHILSVSFGEVDSEAMLAGLDLEGVAVSAGSACTSGAIDPSHVLGALGIPERWQQGVIRFSLGDTTTEAEIERVLSILPGLTARLRGNRVSARKARLA